MTGSPPEVAQKRLQLLVEGVPGLTRVAVFSGGGVSGPPEIPLESPARSLGVELVFGPRAGGFEVAFEHALDRRAEAILVLQGQATLAIVSLAERHRLPAMYWDGAFVDRGSFHHGDTETQRRFHHFP